MYAGDEVARLISKLFGLRRQSWPGRGRRKPVICMSHPPRIPAVILSLAWVIKKPDFYAIPTPSTFFVCPLSSSPRFQPLSPSRAEISTHVTSHPPFCPAKLEMIDRLLTQTANSCIGGTEKPWMILKNVKGERIVTEPQKNVKCVVE